MHDLRRTFLTMGEKLEVPPYVLKKLVNHSVNDITGQYLVLDIERLRDHMSLITIEFLKLLDVENGDALDCDFSNESNFAEVTCSPKLDPLKAGLLKTETVYFHQRKDVQNEEEQIYGRTDCSHLEGG